MMGKVRKYAVGLGPFGPCADRFCPGGYRDNPDLLTRVEMVKQIKRISGLELHSHMFDSISADKWNQILKENNWQCAIVSVNVWGAKKWAQGSLTNPDENIRKEAIREIKKGMDLAKAVEAYKINLWLGQDGHHYPFQTDYRETWQRLIEGITECAQYQSEVKICLEYKLKEPMAHMAVGTVGKALYLCQKINLSNVGVNLDIGHAIQCYENPAESAILLHNEDRLFHLHFNDNYGDWDWDMTTGSIHFWETLELCFWLEKMGWDDYYSFDIFPSKEDPIKMVEANINNVEEMFKIVERLDKDEMLEPLKRRQYIGMHEILKREVFKL